MTPSQYEQRCAEMLRANAHNMTPEEIERMAYGAGDRALQTAAEQITDAEAERDEALVRLDSQTVLAEEIQSEHDMLKRRIRALL